MRFSTKPGCPHTLDLRGRAYQRVAGVVHRVPWLDASQPYNVTVADEPPFVWYRVAKVGTRTIYRHLGAHARLRLDHPPKVRLPKGPYDDYLHFAFVRNPWDRLVSCWHSKVLETDHFGLGDRRDEMRSFRAFVEYVRRMDLSTCDPHLRIQATLFDLERVEFLGRFERFADDLATVCRRLGLPASFTHRNPTAHSHYSAYYDDATADLVGQLYERDVRLFGYQFESSETPYEAR